MGRNKYGAHVACAVIEERQKLDARDEDKRGGNIRRRNERCFRDWVGFRSGCVGFQVGFGGFVFQWISVFCFGFFIGRLRLFLFFRNVCLPVCPSVCPSVCV